MSEEKKESTRRGFLLGLLAGVGAIAAFGGAAKGSAAPGPSGAKRPHDPVLYRRTEEAERYYRTLYN
ncbi:MAG: hypothetical protein HYZ11_02300 [Candidatus Tectomicrobia bacterium]|uniref:Uncharacterized protein n=1 Tax=Tectimicrobiota bacterium TaxID=2528274 RepID=A0A932MM87_UNCTE|nr:hypothetical protein [Candidatus Tectomicrobia bacterium]